MYAPSLIDKARSALEASLKVSLIEHTYTEVEEFAHRIKDIEWDGPEKPSRPLTKEEEAFIGNEVLMCRVSFPYFLRYVTVLTDQKRWEPLRLWPGQQRLLDYLAELEVACQEEHEGRRRVKIRLILLKARQVGGTAFAEALIGHMVFLNRNTQALIASDHPDTSNKLWQTLLSIHAHLPGWMKPPFDAKVKATNLHLPTINSDVIVGSGNQKTSFGQGITVDVAHLTEFSTWIPEMELALKADLFPAFDSSWKHHSLLFIESTAAGVEGNMFHDIFRAAQAGTSLFKPIFLPWYSRPGWTTSAEGVTFTETTIKMAERVAREEQLTLTRGQMAWWQSRRAEAEAEGNLEVFLQEHCGTIEEAFQAPYKSVYPLEVRTRVRDTRREPLLTMRWETAGRKFVNDGEAAEGDDLSYTIWERPRSGCIYVVGVDGAYGMGEDGSSVSVLRVGTLSEPDEQVAEFWSNTIAPDQLAFVCDKVGRMYGDALNEGFPAKMAIEANVGAPGLQTQTDLLKLGYPNFYIWQKPWRIGGGFTKEIGWFTTSRTRPLLTSKGVEGIKRGDLLVNSLRLIGELKSFVSIPNRWGIQDYQHAAAAHDDCQFALFIAYYVAHVGEQRSVADERRQGEVARLAERARAATRSTEPSWQNMVETADGEAVTSDSIYDLVEARLEGGWGH
jgi:hypothetical protein